MAKTSKHKGLKILLIVLISLIIAVGATIGILYAVGMRNGSLLPSSFYVVIDGQKITSDTGGYLLNQEKPLSIEVSGNYTIKVIPAIDKANNFDFAIDGNPAGFAYVDNLTDGFILDKFDGGFTIAPKGDFCAILRAVYPNNDIQAKVENSVFEQDLFMIVITFSDGVHAIRLGCRIPAITNTTHVTLEPSEVEF